MPFKIICEADYALFTDPCTKVERNSYLVPTPSAVEGILKSVFWKPAIRYVVDEIVVFKPIRTIGVRKNEVKEKVLLSAVKSRMEGRGGDPTVYTKEAISQRTSLLLKDVAYGIGFHFEMTGVASEEPDCTEAKYYSIIKRRLEKGQYFRAPCMGCREYPIKKIALTEKFDMDAVAEENRGERDLGVMLYGLKYADEEKLREKWDPVYFSDRAEAVFYHPKMIDGFVDVKKYREESKCC